ncbi:MAG: hypothetical protein IJM51_01550 [Clostridia bacterium]|nr:hypothetical protein [Clostridia bacterium]
MGTEIVVSLITLLGSALGTFGGIFVNGKLTAYRIEQLEKKQDRHNAVIERTYRLEEAVKLHEEKIKVASHRIDELEHNVKFIEKENQG